MREQIFWTVSLVGQAKKTFKELPKGTAATLRLLLEDLERCMMREHMRKRHTKEHISVRARPKSAYAPKNAINWRTAANSVFGDIPSTALNLRGLRNRENLTQAQLGQAIGVEQSNISKMERGVRQIGIKIAKRIEEVFNIDYHLFL